MLDLYIVPLKKERTSHTGYRSSPCCITALVPVHEQLYRAKVHLFLPCWGQGSVTCLRRVRSAHTSQTIWTLVFKRAWALYGLPNVSVALMDIDQEGHRSPLLVPLERTLGTSHSIGRRYQTKKWRLHSTAAMSSYSYDHQFPKENDNPSGFKPPCPAASVSGSSFFCLSPGALFRLSQ